MKTRLLALLALGTLAMLMLIFRGGQGPNEQALAKRKTEISPVAARLQAIGPVAEKSDAERVAIEGASAGESRRCTSEIVPAYRRYMSKLRQLPDTEARQRELQRPSADLLRMNEEELANLGISSTDGILTGPLFPGKTHGAQYAMKFALLKRWVECAASRGEPLRDAALKTFDEELRDVPIGRADPALLEFANLPFRYKFKTDEDARLIAPRIIDCLRAAPDDLSTALSQPLMQTLCEIASQHSEYRDDALHLITSPIVADALRGAYLLQLIGDQPYQEWSASIAAFVASASASERWAGVEALRHFASAEELAPEELLAALPATLYREEWSPLRWAVYELVAKYGGELGVAQLWETIIDTDNPFRSDAVGFLARAGKIDASDCIALFSDPELESSAVHALGSIAKESEKGLAFLRELAADADPELRLAAVQALGVSGRLTAEEFAILANDPDPDVQFDAVLQIGKMDEPNPELLAKLACDPTLDSKSRSKAFQEWLLDSSDMDVPTIFSEMYQDPDPEIHEQGYLFSGALAVASGDEEALARWRALNPPSSILSKAGVPSVLAGSAVGEAATALFDTDIRGKVEGVVQAELQKLNDPLFQGEIRKHQSLLDISGDLGFIGRRFVFQRRVIDYLDLWVE